MKGNKNERIPNVSSIAICVLFIDFMQYLFAYLNTDRLISEMDEKKLEEADYKYDNYYNLSVFFFWAKQVLLSIGVTLFLFCMLLFIF